MVGTRQYDFLSREFSLVWSRNGMGYGFNVNWAKDDKGNLLWIGIGSGVGTTIGASYGTGHTSPGGKSHPHF